MYVTCLLCLFLVGAITYCCLKKTHSYWAKQNVPSLPNPLPIFGHMLPIITARESMIGFVQKIHNNFSSSMVGFYFMQRPGIIVRDSNLVKSVLQTNFSSFPHNLMLLNEKTDPIFAKHPFFTADLKIWKERRMRITSQLTGKMLKYIYSVVCEVSDKMSVFIERKIQDNGEFYECELKTLFLDCTGEIIANTAFAIEGGGFEDQPNRLSFTKVAERLLEPTLINDIKQIIIFHMPVIAKFLGLNFLEKSSDVYMRRNIENILKQRKQSGNVPSDYLQSSADSSSNLDEILADVVGFYFDVHETAGTALTNIIYQLSINAEIQAILRNHISSVLAETNGQLTEESLKKMTYLDQVMQEGLRIMPPLAVLMKCCTKEITLEGSDGLTCHLKPDSPVLISILGMHRDESYWPDPEVFNPERFSPENQINNDKYAFLAFSEGPRMCPGIRLGLMIVKYVTASLITKFSIEHSPKTKVPLEIEHSPLVLGFKGGLWARFQHL